MTRWILVGLTCAGVCLFACGTVLGNAPAAAESESDHLLTPEVLWKLHRLSAPAVSPDGAWAAVSVTRYDVEKDEGFSDIWLIPTKPGAAKRLTTHISKDSNPAWSADGKWIAFVAKRNGDKANQIYIIPTDGGEARRVTDVPTGAADPKWFPNSSRIAFITRVWPDLDGWATQQERLDEREESKVSAKVWDRSWMRYWDHWIDDREAHIYTIDTAGGDPIPVTLNTGLQLSRPSPSGDGFDISSDGAWIAFAADIDTTGVDANYDIHLIPSDGGTPLNITSDNDADDSFPKFGPKGRWLAFSRQKIKGFYADRHRLMLYDLKTKTTVNITESWDRSANGLVWAADGQSLFGAIDDTGFSRVYQFQTKPSPPKRITGDATIQSLAISSGGDTLVGLRQSFTEPPTLVRVRTEDGRVTKLSSFNDETLEGVSMGTYEHVTYTGAGGDEIQMWINYPPRFDPTKRWPLYLLIHGGPHGSVKDSFHWRWNAQVFASTGCVTAWHNFHGSSGFGQSFCDSINPNWADAPFVDTILAAEYFREKKWIDPDRMAAGGGSYGGYLTSIILGRSHPFRTLIVHAGVYNVYTQYGSDYAAGKRRFGEHWDNVELNRNISPHYHAGNFVTPTLVIHGQNDYRVPVNHAFELFNTLQNRGVRSRLIYYPDEAHWILKPQNSIHWYHAKQEWLEKFIGFGPTSE